MNSVFDALLLIVLVVLFGLLNSHSARCVLSDNRFTIQLQDGLYMFAADRVKNRDSAPFNQWMPIS